MFPAPVFALPENGWRKASFSGQSGDCVEVGATAGRVFARDAKDRDGPALAVSSVAWRSFTEGLKAP